MTGIPALPRLPISVFRPSSCCRFFGPSSSTSYQVPISKFSIAASSSPSASTARRSATSSSTVQTSVREATPQPWGTVFASGMRGPPGM